MKYKLIGKYRGRNTSHIYKTKAKAKNVMTHIRENDKIIRKNHLRVARFKNVRIIKIK